MKSKIYAFLLFFFLGQNFTLAGGIEDETKDYENVELTTREDISEFQELQEPLYEKLEFQYLICQQDLLLIRQF